MERILLLAKHLAYDLSNDSITARHILLASHQLDFINASTPNEIKQWAKGRGVESAAGARIAPDQVQADIESARQLPPLTFAPDVRVWLLSMGGQKANLTQFGAAPGSNATVVAAQSSSTPAADSSQAALARTKSKSSLNSAQALRAKLLERVIGQDTAVDALVDMVVKSGYRASGDSPAGVFLFIGPASTGKATLARAFAEAAPQTRPIYLVDMSSLTLENSSTPLNGTERGYQDASEGKATSFIKANPNALIILRNVDKAHPKVIDRCLEPISTGRWTDAKTLEAVDCRQATFIFTTSACNDIYDSPAFASILQRSPKEATEQLKKALGQLESSFNRSSGPVFNPGMLDAMTASGLAFFGRHKFADLKTIVRKQWAVASSSFSSHFGCQCPASLPEPVLEAYLLSLSPALSARNAIQLLPDVLLDPVSDKLMASDQRPQTLHWELEDDASFRALCAATFGTLDPTTVMRRKLQTLRFDTQVLAENADHWVVRLHALRMVKSKDPEDTEGQGSVKVEVPEVRFTDIAGHKLAKSRLTEIVRLLKEPEVLRQYGMSPPKGMLMFGPPGTGKTMLAKALAFEADMPFLTASGPDLLDLHFVKALFQRARKYAPALLFLDELDVVGTRGRGGADVIINQLLVEIDGFDTSLSDPIFIVGATNLPEKLDPALIRAGRLDVHIEIPQLDNEARLFFVEKYQDLPLDKPLDEVAVQRLVKYTSGMSGADLTQVSRESILEMVRHGHTQITTEQLIEQINLRKHGKRPNTKVSDLDRVGTAYHEAGHAVVSMVLNPDMRIEQVTITARGNAAGFVAFSRELETQRTMTRTEILDDMAVSLAGRLAEQKKLDGLGVSAGASSDLRRASQLAKVAISQLGMDEEFGLMALADEADLLHAASGDLLLRRVQVWLKQARENSERVLTEHWPALVQIADRLLENEVVEERELLTIMNPA